MKLEIDTDDSLEGKDIQSLLHIQIAGNKASNMIKRHGARVFNSVRSFISGKNDIDFDFIRNYDEFNIFNIENYFSDALISNDNQLVILETFYSIRNEKNYETCHFPIAWLSYSEDKIIAELEILYAKVIEKREQILRIEQQKGEEAERAEFARLKDKFTN